MRTNGQIGALNRKWNNRKYEQLAKELQKAAGDNMKPIWDFRKNLKNQQKQKYNLPIYKENGTETTDTTQEMQRWTQWIQTHFPHITKENQNIQIEHIKETWGQMEQKIQNGTQAGTPIEALSKIRQKHHYINGKKAQNNKNDTTRLHTKRCGRGNKSTHETQGTWN